MNHRTRPATLLLAGALAIGSSLGSGTAIVRAEPAPDTDDVTDLIDGFATDFSPSRTSAPACACNPRRKH